jgi:ClpP class serine protease
MTWWPGWDSINSAGGWAHFWFWFGMVCFFLLGASEIVAFRYGLRKDELVAIADTNRQKEQQAADARHVTEIGGLKRQLAEADKKLGNLQKGATPRKLTPDQKQALIAALQPFRGQKVSVTTVMGSDDGLGFANDFIEVFRAAQWAIDTGSPSQGVFTGKTPHWFGADNKRRRSERKSLPTSLRCFG